MAKRKATKKKTTKKADTKPASKDGAVEKAKAGIPSRLAKVRGDRSQRAFAIELGVFQQNVNRYEGGTTPHPDFLITLALKEGVSIDWLLTGRGSQKL